MDGQFPPCGHSDDPTRRGPSILPSGGQHLALRLELARGTGQRRAVVGSFVTAPDPRER